MSRTMKRTMALVLALIMAVSLSACGSAKTTSQPAATEAPAAEPAAAPAAISVVDSRGVTVELEKPAERVVCLLNSGLNDLLMLGAGDTVVGIDEWTYTNEITYKILSKLDSRIANHEIPAVDGNMEAILQLNPDVVIIWALDDEKISALESNGIPVVGIQVNNFDEVYTKLHTIAALVGKTDRANEIEAYAKGVLTSISDKTAGLAEKKSGMFVWGSTMLDLAGKTSTGHSILELAGLTDVAEGINEEHFVAKLEDVLQWNPEAILMWNCADIDPDNYFTDSQWSTVKAVQNKDVYEIPDDLTFYCDMWTVKYVFAAQYFAMNVYPELFTELDMNGFRTDMMNSLYGKTAD